VARSGIVPGLPSSIFCLCTPMGGCSGRRTAAAAAAFDFGLTWEGRGHRGKVSRAPPIAHDAPRVCLLVLAGGFPRVLFPPLWCFPPRCAGAVPPCGLLTPRVALLSWDHMAGLRASPRQTWAGSSLAAAGAPQLHASALQQRRRLAHRPAHVMVAARSSRPAQHRADFPRNKRNTTRTTTSCRSRLPPWRRRSPR